MDTATRFFIIFTCMFSAVSATHTPVVNIMGAGGEALSEEMIAALKGACAQAAHKQQASLSDPLCFTRETFPSFCADDDESLGDTILGKEFSLPVPSLKDLARQDGSVFNQWMQAHLYVAAHDAGSNDAQSFKDTKKWKERRAELLLRAAYRHALQAGYDANIQWCRDHGMTDEKMIFNMVNQNVHAKLQEQSNEAFLAHCDAHRIANEMVVDPSLTRKTVGFFDRTFFTPWRRFYVRHQGTIDALSRGLLIASAVAFIFNKLGGTEWLKNKIREMFDKPTVYEVRRRSSGWFGKTNKANLVGEDDLVLSPSVRKQVSELIYLIRRRYELRKKDKKRCSLPLLMLYGPPGTGKTTIAQMIADQTIGDNGKPMNFIKLVASDFMQVKNEGDRVAVLKKMFKKARSLGNTVIFLDEVDGMVRQRGDGDEQVNRAFLDHLLDEIAKPSPDFMVIAATNHINRVDTALLSRFRRKIEVKLPTVRQRYAIVTRYAQRMLRKHKYDISFNMQRVAEVMQGVSGRDIETFFMRVRDRLDFVGGNDASDVVAEQILREMAILPPLPEDEAAESDLESRVMGETN